MTNDYQQFNQAVKAIKDIIQIKYDDINQLQDDIASYKRVLMDIEIEFKKRAAVKPKHIG